MTDSTVILRVDEDLKAAFVDAAKASDRTTSQLLRGFMRDYIRQQSEQISYDAWLAEKAEAGRAALLKGQVVSSEAIEASFAEKRAASVKKVGKQSR